VVPYRVHPLVHARSIGAITILPIFCLFLSLLAIFFLASPQTFAIIYDYDQSSVAQ
jgi:hypothetical protein